jgi:hypothetical protein
VQGELSVNLDTGRMTAYDGVLLGGRECLKVEDLSDPALQTYPALSLLANPTLSAAPPAFVLNSTVGGAGPISYVFDAPLTGRQIGLEDDETNALALVPLTRIALSSNNRDHFRNFRDSRKVQTYARLLATVGTYTFTLRGFGINAFATITRTVTIGAAEPNDTTIDNLVTSLNAVVGRNFTAAATGTIGAKICTITAEAGARTYIYTVATNIFGTDPNTENVTLDLRSLRTVPFYKITGQNSAICISGLVTNVCRAVLGATEIFGTREQTKLVSMGPGGGAFATIEFIDGAQGLYLHDLAMGQEDIFPWQYVTITRLLGTPGTYDLTVQGTGPGAFGPTVVPITIGAAEPNDTTIANIVTALNGVPGNNYNATIVGIAPNTYCYVANDISPLDRYTIVSGTPTVLEAGGATDDQLHILRCKNAANAPRNTGEVLVERVDFRESIGAGINMFGEAGKYVEGVYVYDCDFNARNPNIGLGIGGRSCVELQRGLRDIYFYRCNLEGAKNSALDCEVTGASFFTDYAQRHVHFYDCVFDNIAGRTGNVASVGGVNGATYEGTADPVGTQVAALGDLYLRTAASGALTTYKKTSGGVDSTGWVLAPLLRTECLGSDISFTRCIFREGYVGVLYAERVLFDACRFEYIGGRCLNPAVDTNMAGASLFSCTQQNDDITVRDCTFWRGPNAPSGNLYNVSGSGNGAGFAYRRPAGIRFENNTFYNASFSGFGTLVDCKGLVFRSNRCVMNRGAMDVGAANTAFSLNALNHDTTDVLIADNYFASIGTYKFFWLFSIGMGSVGVRVTRNLTFINNNYADALSTSYADAAFLLMGLSAIADGNGSNHERNPILYGNDGGDVKNLWGASGSAVGRIHPVVSGSASRNSAKVLESTLATPEGTVLGDGTGVIGNVGDRYRYLNRLATTAYFRKATCAVAGVPDNKGWVAETLAPAVLEPIADPAAVFSVVDAYQSSPAFFSQPSGTGAAITLVAGTATRGARTQASTGTTTAGRAARSMSASGGAAIALGAASGIWVYKLLGWSYPIISNATETFGVRFGFQDAITGQSTDGIWFDLEANANADLRPATAQASARTFTSSGVVLAVDTDYDFKIVVTNNTAADFYYRLSSTAASGNWTFLIRHTTNIPTGTLRTFSAGIALAKSAGVTSRTTEWQTQVIYQLPA